jgi:hypothetical protein
MFASAPADVQPITRRETDRYPAVSFPLVPGTESGDSAAKPRRVEAVETHPPRRVNVAWRRTAAGTC